MSWVLTILGIVALIVLHELGHFLAAKAVGMRVERFSLFFPPKLVGVRRGETEYMIGAIPAGGYVKITGMNPEELEDMAPEVAARAYCNQPPWKRIVVILAGPGMNLLIAFVLFWAILASSSYNGDLTLGNLNPSIQTLVPTTSVQATQKGSPARGVLERGDRILAVDGQPATVSSAMRAIATHRCPGAQTAGCRAAMPVLLTVRRAGREVRLSVYPRYNREARRMLVGFNFGAAPKQFGTLAAAGVAAHELWSGTGNLITGIGRAFTSSKARHEVHTIVGIAEVDHEAVAAGAGFGLIILGLISLILAVVNLFPFLPLDGGHVAWALAEKVRGRRISVAAMWRYSTVGILLFAFLFINGLSNDITRLGG
ncbi:MAG TPA: site-2 protease family protein [Solirubrobacteraceae bacterium]|jgi:regulator of sigma E protease|nr:site-2 protease family protein [Solirubrobacteraceae bacterium]